MAAERKPRLFTPEEYLLLEEQAEQKSEYFDGEIFAMAGGLPEHNQIAGNALIALGAQLKGLPCRGYVNDLRLHVRKNGLYTYPDLMIICGDNELLAGRTDTVTNPLLILEVLSKSTRDYDQGEKFRMYRAIPSLRHYLVVEQKAVWVVHHKKTDANNWITEEYDDLANVITLNPPGLQLPLADLYEKITFKQDYE